MDRRSFITALGRIGLGGASFFFSRPLLAGISCTAFNPMGVQRCQVGIDSRIIGAVAKDVQQHAPEWCWAACIEMVFRYYGFYVPQERIVRDTWGSIVNMPGSPYQILADLNRPWVDDRGRPFTVSGETYDANPITASQDLARNMPLIIGTMGHAMVLTSLVYVRNLAGQGTVQLAIVRDPWPGRGRRALAPVEWYRTNFLARIRVHKPGAHDDGGL